MQLARKRHGGSGRFLVGDARDLSAVRDLRPGSVDAVTFLLSIQDMDPLGEVLASAAWALKLGGRVVVLMTHPAFRVPRQSGWVWDEGRKLHYRRVDRYLSLLAVPMKSLSKQKSKGTFATRSFHRPLNVYVNALSEQGLLLDRMLEVPAHRANAPPSQARAAELARKEIPLFLGLRARKVD